MRQGEECCREDEWRASKIRKNMGELLSEGQLRE